jgi:hypothetical protein
MTKQGLLHDYDLMANAEDSSHNVTCAICGKEGVTFQWSDYSGEAMCTQCGCPYQLKWGTNEQQKESKYPYLGLLPDFIPVAREYWNETHKWVCYGTMMGPRPGEKEFFDWCKDHHPEWIAKKEG